MINAVNIEWITYSSLLESSQRLRPVYNGPSLIISVNRVVVGSSILHLILLISLDDRSSCDVFMTLNFFGGYAGCGNSRRSMPVYNNNPKF